MAVIRLELERRAHPEAPSKSALARRADLNQTSVIEATNGTRRLGADALRRLADALGFEGDPMSLMDEVDEP